MFLSWLRPGCLKKRRKPGFIKFERGNPSSRLVALRLVNHRGRFWKPGSSLQAWVYSRVPCPRNVLSWGDSNFSVVAFFFGWLIISWSHVPVSSVQRTLFPLLPSSLSLSLARSLASPFRRCSFLVLRETFLSKESIGACLTSLDCPAGLRRLLKFLRQLGCYVSKRRENVVSNQQ